jgi:hypothetical protein
LVVSNGVMLLCRCCLHPQAVERGSWTSFRSSLEGVRLLCDILLLLLLLLLLRGAEHCAPYQLCFVCRMSSWSDG